MRHGGPYKQANLNKWKLEKYFERKNMLDIWKHCKVLHAVWFPSVDRLYINTIQFPSDGDKSITLSKEALTNTQMEIDKLLYSINLPSGVSTDLSPEEVKKVLSNVLCPSFNLVPSVTSELSIKRNAFNRLLKEQANILNFLEEQPYAVISGVAGTGKTMIAVEKARRHAENGGKVLFLCFNKQLCEFLRENYLHTYISYYTIDGMACSFCDKSIADFELFQEKLEMSYIEGTFPYKHVIIDEGQDFGQNRIEEANIIKMLEDIILDGDNPGTYYLFYDKNQLIQGKQIPPYISEADCKLTLYKNCRNTENIAITSMRTLGKDKMPKMFEGCVKGESPKIFITEDTENQLEFIDRSIKECLNKKIQDIVILTCTTEDKAFFIHFVRMASTVNITSHLILLLAGNSKD